MNTREDTVRGVERGAIRVWYHTKNYKLQNKFEIIVHLQKDQKDSVLYKSWYRPKICFKYKSPSHLKHYLILNCLENTFQKYIKHKVRYTFDC